MVVNGFASIRILGRAIRSLNVLGIRKANTSNDTMQTCSIALSERPNYANFFDSHSPRMLGEREGEKLTPSSGGFFFCGIVKNVLSHE